MRGIAKSYPGVRALDGVDLDVRHGEIHALVGENGAGKSTLLNVLTGVIAPDAGEIELDGARIAPRSPRDAERAGIAAIHQEVDLIPELSLAENLSIGREPKRWWGIDWRAVRERARARMRELGLEIDVARPARSFPLGVQQLACVARALERDAKLVVYDEPTASLEPRDVERLFERMRALKSRGLAQVFVAHSLEQVFAISDRITVLRNGARVGTFATRDLDANELVGHMLGRALGEIPRRSSDAARAKPWLEARGLARRGALGPCDFDVRAGEVLGLAGLVGSGRTELARTLVAADPPTSGELRVDGRARRWRSPRDAAAAGVALCPEDRKVDGLCLGLSVRENVALAWQRRSRFARVSKRAQRELAEHWIRALSIAATPDQTAGTLSGGNQQKVILARWLAANPRLLVLDEPTRGIDVGGKLEIERRIEELAARGLSVIFISSALEEVLRRASRVLVLRDRRIVAELAGGELDLARCQRHLAGEAQRG
jgi:simple sugar transport system ATP-binding protein